MRPVIGCILVLLSVSGFARAQSDGSPPSSEVKSLMELFLEMKAEIAELRQRIQVLEQTTGDASVSPGEPFDGDDDSFSGRGADVAKLRAIKFPDNPTEAAIREYIQKVVKASEGQNSFSSEDPQSQMLVRVGPKYVYLLVEQMDSNSLSYVLDMYFVAAIATLATDEHKKMVLEQLPYRKELVKVVIAKGWARDARAILVQELKEDTQLPMEWYEAMVQLEDPSTYDLLLDKLVTDLDRESIYDAIKTMPGIKLDEAVAKAWDKTKDVPYQRDSFAGVAAAHGNVEALGVVFDNLNNRTRYYMGGSPRQFVLRMTDATGSNTDLRAWYDANRTTIRFDGAAKKFRAH